MFIILFMVKLTIVSLLNTTVQSQQHVHYTVHGKADYGLYVEHFSPSYNSLEEAAEMKINGRNWETPYV